MSIVHLGCAGHFIGADNCQFRLHTIVDETWIVSTVGLYRPAVSTRDRQYETLGCDSDSFFETMVFRSTGEMSVAEMHDGCGCHEHSGSEVDVDRYATAGEARKGHAAMIEKYLGRVA